MSVHFLRGVRSKCACAMVVPWRYHNTIQHNKTTKDYQNFKTALRATRVMYLNEHKDQEKLLTEDWNSQAAQDARLEKEREAKAFEENEKELQRMAEWRFAMCIPYKAHQLTLVNIQRDEERKDNRDEVN